MWGESGMSTRVPRYQPQGLQRTVSRVQRRLFGRILGIAVLAGLCLLDRGEPVPGFGRRAFDPRGAHS